MKYISLCDGIGAAHVAWQPLGWECLAVAEIDPYCNAVVGHHFGFSNLGDITKLTKERILEYGKPDLIIGGTPCQSFSLAGLRQGTASPNGQLIYRFVDIVQSVKPRWLLWENVYGVLSADNGAAFASFVHYLAQCGYGLAWRVLDAQFFGVPQRRRRVFLVGCLGNPAGAGKVLFESESLPWDPAPGGSETEDDSRAVANCLRAQGQLAHRLDVDTVVVDTMTRKWAKGSGGPAGDECQNLVAVPIAEVGKRTGRSTRNPSHGIGIGKGGDPMYTLQASAQHAVACTLTASDGSPNDFTPIIAFDCKQGRAFNSDRCPTLRSMSHENSHINGGGMAAAYLPNELDVRRLTPRECERLQGFPDDYTLVPVKTTKAGEVVYMSDTQRYMQLGNSMATPVVQWIGRRLEAVHQQTYGGSMPKKTTKKAAKTMSLEIPPTAFDQKKLPDMALIEQWNEFHPPGTEVFVFAGQLYEHDILGRHIDLYRTKPTFTKTVSEAHTEKGNGTEPLVDLDPATPGLRNPEGDMTFPMRFMIFPVECFPGHRKYIDDQKCLEVMGMSKKHLPEKPARKKVVKKAVKTRKESPEAMKQRQLDAAYSQLHEIESRLFDAEVVVKACQVGIKEWSFDRIVIERLLFSPDSPPSDPATRKYLMDEIEERVRKIEDSNRRIADQNSATREDRRRLKSVKDRIHRLHTVGPDPQQEFDMEDEA